MLSIYEIYCIIKDNNTNKKDKIIQIILYSVMLLMVSLIGIYFYLNRFGNSLSYYIFKIFNIHY